MQNLLTSILFRLLIAVLIKVKLGTMANSVIQSQANVFPFLSLPLELRLMIYMYALFSPFGLWLDTHRLDIPHLLRMQAIGPAPFDLVAAAKGLRGIVSPALLLVCKQIYYESRECLERNQWRLNRWSTDPIANIPQSVRSRVASLFLGRDSAGLFTPPGVRENKTVFQLIKCLPNIQHLTVGMMEDDKGLSGTPSPGVRVNFADEENLYGAMGWLTTYKSLFTRGSIKSISLECIKKYPSNLYPSVYMWSWVTTMTLHMVEQLGPGKMEKVRDLLEEINLLLGRFERGRVPTYRNYAPLLEPSHEFAARFQTISRLLEEMWEGFGICVSARDPCPFERGTMIVFERISAGGGDDDRLSVAEGGDLGDWW